MLPRRSLVVKYTFCAAVVSTVLLLWVSSPDGGDTDQNLSPWRRLVQGIEMIGLNETQLRIEFEELKTQVIWCLISTIGGRQLSSNRSPDSSNLLSILDSIPCLSVCTLHCDTK